MGKKTQPQPTTHNQHHSQPLITHIKNKIIPILMQMMYALQSFYKIGFYGNYRLFFEVVEREFFDFVDLKPFAVNPLGVDLTWAVIFVVIFK